MRERRRRKREERVAAQPAPPVIPPFPDDPAQALADWSASNLVVPGGHFKNEFKPLILPDFIVDFIRDIFLHRESILCISRKNAKSACVAVFLLGRLVGPIRIHGYRGGVISVSAQKANELKMQMQGIAEASGLEGIEFRRSPAPGHVLSSSGGESRYPERRPHGWRGQRV